MSVVHIYCIINFTSVHTSEKMVYIYLIVESNEKQLIFKTFFFPPPSSDGRWILRSVGERKVTFSQVYQKFSLIFHSLVKLRSVL